MAFFNEQNLVIGVHLAVLHFENCRRTLVSIFVTVQLPNTKHANFPPLLPYNKRLLLEDPKVVEHNSNFISLLPSTSVDPTFHKLVTNVNGGVVEHSPELCSEGEGGVYFLRGTNGRKVAVFKPNDEDPQAPGNPKKKDSATVLRQTIPVGQTSIREAAAFALDDGFAGVPPTHLAFAQGSFFPNPSEDSVVPSSCKMGSLQVFAHGAEPSENVAPGHFSTKDVHRIGIQDIRMLNTDRHGGNILAVKRSSPKEDGSLYDLVPIDHAFCFPTAFGEAAWEWLYWPQSKKPFDAETLRYIENIDPDRDGEVLRSLGLCEDAIALNRAATVLLKMGAAAGMTLVEIARLCLGKRFRDQQEPSVLERAVQAAWDAIGKRDAMAFLEYVKREVAQVIKARTSGTCISM